MEALKTAVMQVNGTSISVADLSVEEKTSAHMEAKDSDGNAASLDASLQSQTFMHAVAQRSGGVIDHFTITKIEKPGLLNKQYTVFVDAYINKFHAAAGSAKKLKIVVAPVRLSQAQYDVGGLQVSAATLSDDLTQRITNALVQSGRFDVLNRDANPAVAEELQLISSGGTDKKNLAKLNQTIPADVVLAPSLDALAYTRHSQNLAISDRPLVSYDGHWAFSDKIINVTTSELMGSAQFQGDFPKVSPTTMPVNVDGQGLLAAAEDKIVNDAVAQIIQDLFPITVVSVQGNVVVLSQGGSALEVGKTYRLMQAGQLIKDPQTGEVIGHVTMPIGEVAIDRVDDKLSYGHLVQGSPSSLATNGSVRIGKVVATSDDVASSASASSNGSDGAPHIAATKNSKSVQGAGENNRAPSLTAKPPQQTGQQQPQDGAAPPPKTDPNW